MAKQSDRLTRQKLTEELRRRGNEVISMDDNGDPVTRLQALAELTWKYALGYTEETRDDKGQVKTEVHRPAPWAAQYVFERLDGKVAIAAIEETTKPKAAERVRDLAVARINALARKVKS